MSHSSKIKDADAFFEVDAITRQIINKTPQKITLIQYDHNSESFTFSLPRHIEGHDMAESAKAEVHFINIETGGANSHADKYEMKDLQPDPNDESKVICTWLISSNATQYAGRLAFMIRFACLDDNDNYVYVWNTATNEEISITNGMDNGAAIVEEYPDILAQWRKDVLADNAYITDFFKIVPEGKTIDDLDDVYEHGGVYLLGKNGIQTGRCNTLEVTGGWYWDEQFGGDLATTYQIKTEHDGFGGYTIKQRCWKKGKWSAWENVFGGSGGGSITVDQTYNPKSENAQSGIAVAEAIEGIGGGSVNAEPTVLADFTLEEETDVVIVPLSDDAFNYKSILIYIDTQVTATGQYWMYLSNLESGTKKTISHMNGALDGANHQTHTKIDFFKNYCFSSATDTMNYQYNSTYKGYMYPITYKSFVANAIYLGAMTFPVGTTIKVEGVM